MAKKQTTYRTAVQDLIDWIDRVEERGISQLSTAKIRERIKERLPMEKDRMILFAQKSNDGMIDTPYKDTFDELFPSKPTDKDETI